MENNFNPTKEGFMPLGNMASGDVQNATPESPEPGRYQSVRNAFSKAGLAFLVLYLAISVIGGLVKDVPCIIKAVALLTDGNLEDLEFQSSQDMIYALRYFIIQLMPTAMLWSTIGTGVGIGVGIIFEKLILKKVPAEPIAKRKLAPGEYFFYLLLALGLWACGALAGNIAGFFGLNNVLNSVFSYEGAAGWVITVYTVFGAPVLEELACRKVLLDKLHGYGEVPAAFFSALLFGLFHGNSTQFTLAFAVGMAFALVYMKTGNILYTISFHMIINALGSVSGFMELLGCSDAVITVADSSLNILLAVLAVCGCVLAIVKRRSPMLKLERADYANGKRAVFKGAGYIIFKILMIVTVITIDLMNIITNSSAGALCLICLLPTAVFFAIIIWAQKTAVKAGKLISSSGQK